MEKKGSDWISAVIIAVPLIVAIVLAVLMGYVNISKWTGGVRRKFWLAE